MKQPRVIKLVHRLIKSAPQSPRHAAIRNKAAQSLQQISRVEPADAETLQNGLGPPNIPTKHQMQRNVLWLPRHHNARGDVLGALQALFTTVVRNNQKTIGSPLLDLSRNHQSTHSVRPELPLFCWRSSLPQTLGPVRIVRRLPGSSVTVYAIQRTIVLKHLLPLRELKSILRERDRVSTELAQTRHRHRNVIHLHVLQRHKHRLRHGSAVKQIL